MRIVIVTNDMTASLINDINFTGIINFYRR